MEKRAFIWTLASAAIVANLADAMTTFIALTYFGLGELNPLMAFLYNYPMIGYPIKLVVVTWFLLPLPYCPVYKAFYNENKWVRWVGISGLIFAIVVFTSLAVNNMVFILNSS